MFPKKYNIDNFLFRQSHYVFLTSLELSTKTRPNFYSHSSTLPYLRYWHLMQMTEQMVSNKLLKTSYYMGHLLENMNFKANFLLKIKNVNVVL